MNIQIHCRQIHLFGLFGAFIIIVLEINAYNSPRIAFFKFSIVLRIVGGRVDRAVVVRVGEEVDADIADGAEALRHDVAVVVKAHREVLSAFPKLIGADADGQ